MCGREKERERVTAERTDRKREGEKRSELKRQTRYVRDKGHGGITSKTTVPIYRARAFHRIPPRFSWTVLARRSRIRYSYCLREIIFLQCAGLPLLLLLLLLPGASIYEVSHERDRDREHVYATYFQSKVYRKKENKLRTGIASRFKGERAGRLFVWSCFSATPGIRYIDRSPRVLSTV